MYLFLLCFTLTATLKYSFGSKVAFPVLSWYCIQAALHFATHELKAAAL